MSLSLATGQPFAALAATDERVLLTYAAQLDEQAEEASRRGR